MYKRQEFSGAAQTVGVELKSGEKIELRGFGSFRLRERNSREGRNPKTGEEVPILPRRVLVFRPSQVLKSRVSRQQVINNPVDENDHR